MFKNNLSKLASALCLSIVISGAGLSDLHAAPMTFQSAVAEYKAGKYQSALAMFKAFAKASPNNVTVHYYTALCHHALNHVEQARQEYNFVIANGEPSFKALAEKAMSRLGSAQPSSATAASQGPTSPSQAVPARRAKKVIDFYADW